MPTPIYEITPDGTETLVGTVPDPVPTTDDVDTERDRRITGGMTFNGVRFQTRAQDLENIQGASTMAFAAMVNGAQAGNYYWNGGTDPFTWIAEDNSLHQFDAQTMWAFGQAVANHKSSHIFAARTLKDMATIPADYAADSYWPVA